MFKRQYLQLAVQLHKKLLLHPSKLSNSQYRQLASGINGSKFTSQAKQFPTGINKPMEVKVKSSSQPEELLEKLIAGLSSDIYQKNRVYKNDLMKVIDKVSELNFSTKKQGLQLIRCCTELLPDETPSTRMALVEQIWNVLQKHTKFETEHYNELLRVYIANNRTITASRFISQMAPLQPNITTYELILRALGEAGDFNQATEVIANMKSLDIPATENIFNSLILCQGKSGNLQNIQEVLSMMKSLKLEPTVDTITAKVRALIWNKKYDVAVNEMNDAYNLGLEFNEENVMEIVKTLAFTTVYQPIPKVLKFLPKATLNSPSISPYMQSVTTHLVFQNHPMAALEVYKCLPLPSFGPHDDKGLHGRSLVRDCVKAGIPSNVISLITQELMGSGRNPIAIQNACEAALQLGKIPLALDLFIRMQQLGMPIRPHYFWPILLSNSKSFGENGIMTVLQTMVNRNVTPDYDTMKEYVLPYVSFNSPQNLMKKLTDAGLNISDALTPMMEMLLNTGQVRAASEICELFPGKVDAEKLLKPLLKGYLISSDLKSTIFTLEDIKDKASDKNKDWIGRFFCICIQNKNVRENISEFVTLIKAISQTELRISAAAVDYCVPKIPESCSKAQIDKIHNTLIAMTDEKLIDDSDMFISHMPHPKNMNEAGLRSHLIELEAKGMNTRGVLRKLLQMYCRQGNLSQAREIAQKCQKEGVFLSAGMKAAIFDLHVKLSELDLAESSLADLNKSSPNFTLDEFKVIDFATLMVHKKKINKAMHFVKNEANKRRITGGRGIEINCWRLLDAVASTKDLGDTRGMLDLLISCGYCKPTNVILGPLVRVHLHNNNLETAVHEFADIAQKYNKTPLKHELLCQILLDMSEELIEGFLVSEKSSGNKTRLAHTVLTMDRRVHGAGDVQLTLISALADIGYKKTLRKMFLDPMIKFHPDALLRRCERFAQEKKVHALFNIAECAKDIRHIDTHSIYELILDVFQRNGKVDSALELWNKLQEQDFTPTQKFMKNLCALLKANNKEIPSDLALLIGKQAKKVTSKKQN